MNYLLDFLPYYLPVVVGAAIGYLTNVLAIKMLFRPLVEKRLFGLRIPFTPGILPRNRKRLAESLGNTVARELLSPEVIKGRLGDTGFRLSVRSQIGGFLDGILEIPVRELFDRGNGSRVKAVLGDVLQAMLGSDGAKVFARAIAESFVRHFGNFSIRDIVQPESAAAFFHDVAARLETGKPGLHQALDGALSEESVQSKPLSRFLPSGFRDMAERAFLAIYPAGFKALLSYLESDDARATLTERGRELTDIVIARLPTVQKWMISLAGYQQKLHEEMPDIVQDLVESFRKEGTLPSTSAGLSREAGQAIADFIRQTMGEIEKNNPGIRNGLHSLLDRMIDTLGNVDVRTLVEKILSAQRGGFGDRKVIDVLAALTGLTEGKIAEKLEGIILSVPRRFLNDGDPESHPIRILFSEEILSRSAGDLLGLRGDIRERLEFSIVDLALDLLERKTAEIVATVDIRKVVVDRVNSLEMETLEKIVLDVMKEQFFWIDIFGGILGGLIGAVQVALYIFLP